MGLPFWFVAGYGTARSLPVPFSTERIGSPGLERLASLFDRGRIVGTGFADILKSKLVKPYARVLQHALLDQNGTLPRIDRLELRGKGGVKSAKHLVESHRFEFQSGSDRIRVPATWLSQGYQATISWIADLVGQMFWDAEGEVDLSEMEGLVLIDELDLHLHPLWQVGLVRALKATFPRVQFIVTTHSPMLLPGLESDEIIRLKLDDAGNVTYDMAEESPALLTGSQIYQDFFGIDKLYPTDTGEASTDSDILRATRTDRTTRMRKCTGSIPSSVALEWSPGCSRSIGNDPNTPRSRTHAPSPNPPNRTGECPGADMRRALSTTTTSEPNIRRSGTTFARHSTASAATANAITSKPRTATSSTTDPSRSGSRARPPGPWILVARVDVAEFDVRLPCLQ